jgi:Tol biopolymer transport system component
MQVDGRNLVQLTSGTTDSFPSISPDGRWVIYTAQSGGKPALWKVSIDGGRPELIMDRNATMGVISPDGKYIAYTYPESADATAPPNRIAVMPIEGGEPIKTFQVNPGGTVLSVIQWANDGKSLLYTVTGNNITNIWSQPLGGGPAKQVTEFKEMLMTGFAWSRDGKQLACTRGNLVRDAVLIRDLK